MWREYLEEKLNCVSRECTSSILSQIPLFLGGAKKPEQTCFLQHFLCTLLQAEGKEGVDVIHTTSGWPAGLHVELGVEPNHKRVANRPFWPQKCLDLKGFFSSTKTLDLTANQLSENPSSSKVKSLGRIIN